MPLGEAGRTRVVFPPIGYPIAGVLAVIALRTAGFASTSVAWVAAGAGLLVIGVAGFCWAVLVQVQAKTSPNPYSATTALVTHGPYRWSRNPIYVCDLLIQAGTTFLIMQPWGAVFLAPVFFGLRRVVVRCEEPCLRRLFPDQYPGYCRQTRRWFGRAA